MKVTLVRVARRVTTSREYDAITLVISDMQFSRDVGCSRDIRQAKRIATESGAEFWCDPAVLERFPGGQELA